MMQFLITEEEAREFAQLERSAGCDIGAGRSHFMTKSTTGHLKNVLNYLPDPVVEALEDNADTYGLTDAQVIELAIANLLDLETTSLSDLKNLETLAQLKERVAMLEAVMRKNGLTVPELPEQK